MFKKVEVGDVQMVELDAEALAVTEKILELNKMIIQQNEILIKSLMNPQFKIESEGGN